jgi:hypothetical protein
MASKDIPESTSKFMPQALKAAEASRYMGASAMKIKLITESSDMNDTRLTSSLKISESSTTSSLTLLHSPELACLDLLQQLMV